MTDDDKKTFEYKLPKETGVDIHKTANNSMIIIGANGSGKSRLGAWIEQIDMENVHRIGAQRSLVFGDYIQLKSSEQSKNLLLYGRETMEPSKHSRWNGKFTSTQNNDYEYVLSMLIAQKNNQHESFVELCKEKKEQRTPHTEVPHTVIDDIKEVWNQFFPQRQISFDDSKVTAIFSYNGSETKYKGVEMSDGERVALYLIAQCLSISGGKTIIIDEPEIHLHKSIMNNLWSAIENKRNDCFFIYITHDTQFAANHKQADKIWVKSFDGRNKWEWEKIENAFLPENLLLDILGNRKPVLFVEGTSDSYDTKLYSQIYKNYYVVPCGSCSQVILRTKAMRANERLHDLKAYGVIDRDYRVEHELNSLEEHYIFAVAVAEIENLFLIEELLTIVNAHLGFNDTLRIDQVKKYIIEDRYLQQLDKQVCKAVVSELKHQLSTCDLECPDDQSVKQRLSELYENISFDTIKADKERIFDEVKRTKDYKGILKIFNYKDLSRSIGCYFGINNQDYCDLVII